MKTYKTVFNVVRKKLNIWLMTSRPCVAKFLFFPLFPLFSISCLRFLYIPSCVLCHRFCPCRNEWSFKGQRGDNWILSSTFSFCSSRRKALVTHFNFSALLSSWCSSVTLFCLFFPSLNFSIPSLSAKLALFVSLCVSLSVLLSILISSASF